MKLSNPKHEYSHRVHLTAMIQAERKLRMVLLVDNDRLETVPFCLRSAECLHCKWILTHYMHVHLGMLQPMTRVETTPEDFVKMDARSPFEVNAVPSDHRSTTK